MPKTNQLFVEGLHRDNEVSLQPENSYRDARNMRLLSNEENSFSLVSINGNEVKFELTTDGFMPIGWASYIEKDTNKRVIVVFSTNATGEPGGAGEIGTIEYDSVSEKDNYIPRYHHDDLNFTKTHPIINEAIGLRENSSIKRVYWTDNYNQPRALNLNGLDSVPPASLVTGQQYMCVKGTVVVSATSYGPGEAAGQVFTYPGSISGYAYPSDIVVPYTPIELLDLTPSKETGNINFLQETTGELYAGTYQYTYRLRNDEGYVTAWSYLSEHVLVSPDPISVFSLAEYQDYQGEDSSFVTTKGNTIQIDNVDTIYDEIEVAAFHATTNELTEDGVIFFRGAVTGATMTFDHLGGENLGTVTDEDLTVANIAVTKAKTITNNNNRLFLGNIETREELGTFDPSSATITPFIYETPSDLRGDMAHTDGLPIWGHVAAIGSGTGVPSGAIRGRAYYKVTVGTVTYNAVVYNVGDVFQGVNGVRTYTGGGTVVAITHIKKYDIFAGGSQHRDTIIHDDFYDYKGTVVSEQLRGYMRGERYRIGFLPYDLQGNPMFVRWIGDIDIPTQDDGTSHGTSWEVIDHYISGGGVDTDDTILRICGLEIDSLDITGIEDKISGFSIVRSKRDKQRYSQGVLLPIVDDGTDDHPMSANVLGIDDYYRAGGGNNRTLNRYTYISPEHLFSIGNYWDFSIINDSDKIRLEDYYEPVYQGGTNPGNIGSRTETIIYHYYQKFYQNVATPSGAKAKGSEETIEDSATVAFGAIVTDYLSSGRDFNNRTKIYTGAIAPLPQDDNGVAISGLESRGMSCTVLRLAGSETAGSGFGAVNSSDIEKPICSLIRSSSNLYGGTSESALAASTYITAGHYQDINATVLSEIDDGSSNYIFNGVQVFGGDTFINLMDVARTVKDNYTEDSGGQAQISHALIFPIESEINVGMREGRHVAREGSFEWQPGPIITNSDGVGYTTSVGGTPTQGPIQPEQFIYENSYSYDESNLFYPGLPVNLQDNNESPNRIQYSNEKVNGEEVDSWRIFGINNYKDIESQNGEINNIRYKLGRMIYWQYGGVGFLSVNERVVVGDILGAETRLGVGGILDRYDERTRYYGNQNQHSLTETPDGYAWFDNNNKAVCWMSVGGQLVEMNVVNGLQDFFRDNIVGDAPLQDNPILNQGIAGVYDPKYKEILLVFKVENDSVQAATNYFIGDYAGYGGYNYRAKKDYYSGASPDPDPGTDTTNWELVGESQFTIGFLDMIKKFSGIYDFVPATLFKVNDKVLTSSHGTYATIKDSTGYSIGFIVTEGDDNYVCHTAYTSGSPATVPSSDTAHWIKVSDISEIYEHDSGDICKFFGIVYDNKLKVVTNVARDQFKVFDTYEHIGNDEMFTDVLYSNSYQNSSDLNADNLYEFQNRSWKYPVALDTFARMRDHYMETELRKDNKDENETYPITESKNSKIKIISLNIGFRLSK